MLPSFALRVRALDAGTPTITHQGHVSLSRIHVSCRFQTVSEEPLLQRPRAFGARRRWTSELIRGELGRIKRICGVGVTNICSKPKIGGGFFWVTRYLLLSAVRLLLPLLLDGFLLIPGSKSSTETLFFLNKLGHKSMLKIEIWCWVFWFRRNSVFIFVFFFKLFERVTSRRIPADSGLTILPVWFGVTNTCWQSMLGGGVLLVQEKTLLRICRRYLLLILQAIRACVTWRISANFKLTNFHKFLTDAREKLSRGRRRSV